MTCVETWVETEDTKHWKEFGSQLQDTTRDQDFGKTRFMLPLSWDLSEFGLLEHSWNQLIEIFVVYDGHWWRHSLSDKKEKENTHQKVHKKCLGFATIFQGISSPPQITQITGYYFHA